MGAGSITPLQLGGAPSPDRMDTPAGPIPRIEHGWSRADRWGRFLCRLSNRFRMNYRVGPGLYALGEPRAKSPVLVTANYKLSFDILRRDVRGLDAWILVLDTRGINVWCAAGKSTFGTVELVHRLQQTRLKEIVNHRGLILPQLGAPGVSAHHVRKMSGFSVSYGPVRSSDLNAYLQAGGKAAEAMRRVGFPLVDRLVLTPMEILPALKYLLVFLTALLPIFGFSSRGFTPQPLLACGLPYGLMGLTALLTGTFLFPLLLPWIPSRSFAVKGWLLGLLPAVPFAVLDFYYGTGSPWLLAFILLFFPAVSSYLALNFTGSTPFTGISGVRKELSYALPLYAAAGGISVLFLILHKIIEWRSL